MYGADRELAAEAEKLADKWLADRSAADPEIASAVLRASAWYGNRALAERYITAFTATTDRLDQEHLLAAMRWFRDPAAVSNIEQALLTGRVKFMEGFGVLVAGA